MIDSPETLNLIENASLLQGIPREILTPLFKQAELHTLKQGERLVSPGIINEHVYIIISGHLSVQVTPSSLDEPIAVLNPGDCVGEMSVLVDSIVSAYVIASTDCQLFSIDYASFWSLLNGSSVAARNMLNILVQRIRLGNEVVADSLLQHKHLPVNDIIDNLTGLFNRHGMQGKFDRLLQRCSVGKEPLCLIVLEIDAVENAASSVKDFRDEQPLRTTAQLLLTFLRPDDHAARLIGKKFAVLLADSPLADALITAERLRATISQIPIVMPDGSSLPPFTISLGVCEATANDTWSTLIERCNAALTLAISAGGNCIKHA